MIVEQIDVMRPKQSFNHAHTINKSHGIIEEILDWCKHELTEDWRWQLREVSTYTRNGEYIFYFDGEKDYFAFVLKWG
jgi:hypothetical protein